MASGMAGVSRRLETAAAALVWPGVDILQLELRLRIDDEIDEV